MVAARNPTSAEGIPDARSTLMERNNLISIPASPGEDTQHDDAEREEREDLATVHLTGPSLVGAAATLPRRASQGRSRGGQARRGQGQRCGSRERDICSSGVQGLTPG